VEDDKAAGRDPNSLTMLRDYRTKAELQLRQRPAYVESVSGSRASPVAASRFADLMATNDLSTSPAPAAIGPEPPRLPAPVSMDRAATPEQAAPTSTYATPEEIHDGDQIAEGEHETFRGLEQRTSFERQRNKFLAIRSVLSFHQTIKAQKAAAAAKANMNWNAAMAEENADIITSKGINHPSSPHRMPVTNGTVARPPTVNIPAQAEHCLGTEDSNREAQVLAAFTSKVNQYAALVAARTAQQDFVEAYPDIVAARRRMSDQILSIPKKRLPMRSSEDGYDSSSDSDDDSIIDMDETDVRAARRMGGLGERKTSSRRQFKLGKRKSWANVMDGDDVSSSSFAIKGGHDSLVVPYESTLHRTHEDVLPSAGLLAQRQTLGQFRQPTAEKRNCSVRGDGQQLEVEAGQSRKRRSITGPLIEVMEKFSLEETEKDENSS